jgi:predicted hotdog family 3-hydroxylacyl-ACP dehydratase
MTDFDLNSRLEQFTGASAAEFLLHREPMLLIDRMLYSRDNRTTCEWEVAEGGPFVEPGLGIAAYVGVEFMAQCIAVHAGVRARARGFGPPLGFLLGTRHYTTISPRFGIGETFRVTCEELIRDSNGMGSYDCSILLRGISVAEARLSVLEKDRGQELSG